METRVVPILLSLLALRVREMTAASDAMKYIALGFIKVLDECKHELNQTDRIMTDLYHFWTVDKSGLSRDTGCAIICMGKKLGLMDEGGHILHDKAREFAQKHGADSEVATKLVSSIHSCEQQYTGIPDDCGKVSEVAKCLRDGIKELNWTPKVDVVAAEVLTEI